MAKATGSAENPKRLRFAAHWVGPRYEEMRFATAWRSLISHSHMTMTLHPRLRRSVLVVGVPSDNGREYCGREDPYPYELFLQLEEIDHKASGSPPRPRPTAPANRARRSSSPVERSV